MKMNLQWTIILLVCFVVFVVMLVTHLLIGVNISERALSNQEEKAMMIARTAAKSPIIINGLLDKSQEPDLQNYAEDIRRATDVYFVVVINMEGIRKSHPDQSKIGLPFVGGDEEEVLRGDEHVSVGTGTLGESLRAFTPVFSENGKQIGAVSVGISVKNVQEEVSESRSIIYLGILFGTVIGVLGAVLLAKRIKNNLFGLEPSEIARVYVERNTMLQSMFEGVVAIDQNGIITLANKKAYELFQQVELEQNLVGLHVEQWLPSLQLYQVLQTGKPLLNRESELDGLSLMVNSVPLYEGKKVIGAISTFRDKTEVRNLAEQLTGAKEYADALRAQTHEFMNKLQVILGMIHMKFFDRIPSFVNQITKEYQTEVGYISRRVKDPILAGFLLAKLSYAREQGIEFSLQEDTMLPDAKNEQMTTELVKILGNLIDNSFDAVLHTQTKSVQLHLQYNENVKLLHIAVSDTGIGMNETVMEKILKKGYSTKAQGRGYGMYLVYQSITNLNGQIKIDSKEHIGTTIQISIPYESKGE